MGDTTVNNPDLAPPGVNDVQFADWQVLGARKLTCWSCEGRPEFDSAEAFNAHLNAVHPVPRRLVCVSSGFACGRRQMGMGPERGRKARRT